MNRPDLSPLQNRGVMVVNAGTRSAASRTLVVLGVARSGTSLIAGALHHLGVPMGNAQPPVYEDLDLAAALDEHAWKRLDELIGTRNAAHAVWGWKRPAFLRHAKRLHPRLRHPEYVVVFRDLLAIANRNHISVREDPVQDMRSSLEQYGAIFDFLGQTKPRALLVSYEKAIQRPDDFIAALARFAGVADRQRLAAARAFVEPEAKAYLLSARATDGAGHLDFATTRVISGWAYARGQAKAVEVEIVVNGGVLARVKADKARPDLKASGAHATGNCGFKLKLSGEEGVRAGDRVSVRVAGDIKDLANSPVTVKPAEGDVPQPATHGVLDRATSDFIAGWAMLPGRAEPALVEIFANGSALATVPADQMRSDIKSAGLHPSGKCGFRLSLNGSEGLRPGDVITARIAGRPDELLNSPRPLLAARGD